MRVSIMHMLVLSMCMCATLCEGRIWASEIATKIYTQEDKKSIQKRSWCGWKDEIHSIICEVNI